MHPSVSCRSLRFLCALPLGGFLFFAAPAPASSSSPIAENRSGPTITTVSDAFARWINLKDDTQPVRIEGVVTNKMPNGAFRLHDGNLGIYVTKSPEGLLLTPGDQVAVAGVLRQGGFSPWISPHEVVPKGRGKFPEARRASFSVLATGSADNQWLEIEGVIRAVHVLETGDFVELDLGMTGGNLRVLVNDDQQSNFEPLIDAVVRMRGVAAVNVNKHGHVVAPSFRVPSFAEIVVVKPSALDPFAQPLVPIERLMKSSLGGSHHHHRVRTSGVVTRRLSPTMFFLRNAGVGLKVETSRPVDFRAGDVVEAAGFPIISENMAVLQQAIFQRQSPGEPPIPVTPDLATLLDGTHNSDLVRVRARLVDWVVTEQNVTLIFQKDDELFKGLLNYISPDPLKLPEKNSWVEVTGICVISELDDVWFYKPRSFLLLLADLTDLTVVQKPTWWTPERLWRALAISLSVLLAAAGWVWALRRQVERKRAVIEQQARHAAALEERSRIARELHDTLEQGLTGLSLQMKAMETDLNGTDHPVRSRLQFARQMLRQSRALARNAIRELRTENLPARPAGLVEGLRRAADSWNHSGALTVTVQVAGEVRALSPRLEQHLVGIGTEAMTNAVKHGQAGAIQVEIEFRDAEVMVRIKDTGIGFDPAQRLEQASGCFGLLGMRERAREIRGDIRIHSQPGRGTEVVVTAPFTHPANTTEEASLSPGLPVRIPAQ